MDSTTTRLCYSATNLMVGGGDTLYPWPPCIDADRCTGSSLNSAACFR